MICGTLGARNRYLNEVCQYSEGAKISSDVLSPDLKFRVSGSLDRPDSILVLRSGRHVCPEDNQDSGHQDQFCEPYS